MGSAAQTIPAQWELRHHKKKEVTDRAWRGHPHQLIARMSDSRFVGVMQELGKADTDRISNAHHFAGNYRMLVR
jgi:hypothetical protein